MPSIFLIDRYRRSVEEVTTDFLPADPHNVGEAPRCEACGSFVGMSPWKRPHRAEIETWGSVFGDLAFGPGDSFLASQRFRSLWEREGLIGLHGFEPVEIVRVRHRGKTINRPTPQYLHVWAGRSDAAVDQVRSGILWMSPPTCQVCRVGTLRSQERIVLEGEPKENIFIARGLPGQILVDQEFKHFCEENAITNCPLIEGGEARYPTLQSRAVP